MLSGRQDVAGLVEETVLGYCDTRRDPSLFFRNTAPQPRQLTWTEGEATRLVKAAWRAGLKGLAACLATAWDSQLSPVDVRRLAAQDMRQDDLGIWFDLARGQNRPGRHCHAFPA